MDLIDYALRYAIPPIITIIFTMGWYMFKKHDERLERLEYKDNELEKTQIQINTAFQYLSKDLSEIKELIKELKRNGPR